jgi:hypothetical protein
MLRMTYHLINVTICAKSFQNPLIYGEVMDGTQNIPNNRPYLPLTSKCDLDLGGRGTGVVLDISPYYSDYLCQVSKSLEL